MSDNDIGLDPAKRGRDRVERWVDIQGSPREVWEEVGQFSAIEDWHPGVQECELVELDGQFHRHLSLADGEMLLERFVEAGDDFYRYEIVEGPLPVEDYVATFTVSDHEGLTRIFWSATFEADGHEADEIVAAMFETGLAALRDRFDA
ncbi:MAG: SRPBCC family protein [Pseudomonadota bacterium]